MPTVKVERTIDGNKDEVYQAVKKYMEERGTLQKLGGEVDWNDKKAKAFIEGNAFEGEITVTEKGGKANIAIEVQLGMLVGMMKGKVKEELTKHLGRIKV